MTIFDRVLAQLRENQDETYRKFNESLIPGAENTSIGVRIPILRTMSKALLKEDWQTFLAQSENSEIHEIILLRGLVIGGARIPYNEKLALTAAYVPTVTNWASCDTFCSCMKDAKKHLPETFVFLRPYLASDKEFHLRFAIVMLMDYFLTDSYIDEVLGIFCSTNHPGYYVKMAVAWALSTAFVKYRDKTLSRLEARTLDPWVQNKAIQKCRESYRVSAEDKENLKTLKYQSSAG